MAPKEKNKVLFEDSEDEYDGGAKLQINDDYAKRFEHNKKREERHRLEEKYGKSQVNGRAQQDEEESDSSDDETEDEDGYLATEELDAQLNATLEALRKKDPRIYDPEATFYSPIDADAAAAKTTDSKEKKDKPVTLRDYHRERILAGDAGGDEEEQPYTYAQEQDDLKNSILGEIRAQLEGGDESEAEEDRDFLKPKAGEAERIKAELSEGMHPSRAAKVQSSKKVKPLTSLDVANAEKDPQLYLSNFLASRAWIAPEKNNWEAFDSDEEEEGHGKADEWEVAYNLRFEDPNKSNEVLKSYSRDVAAAKSVRREDKTGRKKKREEEREQKEAEKQERREERNRLRNLKIEEAETKLKQIKKAAGLAGKELNEEEWMQLLDGAWDNEKWEQEMSKKFGDQYYAEGEGGSDAEVEKKPKVKKPKWDDDIDIKDLVPDFEDDEPPKVILSDVEDAGEAEEDDEDDDEEDGPSRKRQKTSKDRKRERLASQKEARKERSKLEALVDAKMDIDDPLPQAGSSKDQGLKFNYRETWAESYGLTARDILMAPSDTALNEFVGLKKLAHFRPADKKSKDKKRLGKKARLRQWRRETFGRDAEKDGPAFVFGGDRLGGDANKAPAEESNIVEGSSKKRKKRSGRGKEKSSA